MVRHYSTRNFFRHFPTDLPSRYFEGHSLCRDVAFSPTKEDQPNELFEAWRRLPEEHRKAMEAEFREIFEMGCEKGV